MTTAQTFSEVIPPLPTSPLPPLPHSSQLGLAQFPTNCTMTLMHSNFIISTDGSFHMAFNLTVAAKKQVFVCSRCMYRLPNFALPAEQCRCILCLNVI